ncbi:uncharacterized protein BJ212DRAFT_1387318, partial [Suillus subaureus]
MGIWYYRGVNVLAAKNLRSDELLNVSAAIGFMHHLAYTYSDIPSLHGSCALAVHCTQNPSTTFVSRYFSAHSH